jgi:predicted amidohydrolase
VNFTVALLQIAPFGNDLSRNLQEGLKRCREAKSRGADFVVFPELWSIGATPYPTNNTGREPWGASALHRSSDFLLSFSALAADLSLNVAITYLEAHLPKPRNSVAIINASGEIVLNYSKVFICDFGEAELLKPEFRINWVAGSGNSLSAQIMAPTRPAPADAQLVRRLKEIGVRRQNHIEL